MTKYPRIVLAATQSGAGKTTVTLGIELALSKRGLAVQPFKTGPDYIDPLYHTAAVKRFCRNLDTWLLPPAAVLELFEKEARDADISVIEGVMGLYDGAGCGEKGSTAHLAKITASPVILILNAASLSRSSAAMVLGYRVFDSKVDIKGIILNKIGSDRHYRLIKDAIEKKTRMPVLGFLPRNPKLALPERHLGLDSDAEKIVTKSFCKALSDSVEKNIDVDGILKIARRAKRLARTPKKIFGAPRGVAFGAAPRRSKPVVIAIAMDKAFHFYYRDNLDILRHLGARLAPFSPLADTTLPPDADGIYIGGGYPELFAKDLAVNKRLRKAVYERAAEGMPVYAECGGLMYLVKKLVDFRKKSFPMAGVFDGSAVMAHQRQALGYIELESAHDNILSRKNARIRAHTFHWSYLDGLAQNSVFAYRVKKNQDTAYRDGLIRWNVLAGYAHLHFASNTAFAKNFIRSCADFREKHDKKNQ